MSAYSNDREPRSPPPTPSASNPPGDKGHDAERAITASKVEESWWWRMLWMSNGFKKSPSLEVLKYLGTYALSASAMFGVNKALARESHHPIFSAIMVVQIQLGASLVFVAVATVRGWIDVPWKGTAEAVHERYAWMTIAVAFAAQLVASIRTLETAGITEWYMLLHYLTPCVVPLLERQYAPIVNAGEAPPLYGLIFPLFTVLLATAWSIGYSGVFGPGTREGCIWSALWLFARVLSLVASRAAILKYKTPVWNRLLYQNASAFVVVAVLTTVFPQVVEVTWQVGSAENMSSPRGTMWALLAASCALKVLVSWSRLAILGEATASAFSTLSSVGLIPARAWFAGIDWFDAGLHH